MGHNTVPPLVDQRLAVNEDKGRNMMLGDEPAADYRLARSRWGHQYAEFVGRKRFHGYDLIGVSVARSSMSMGAVSVKESVTSRVLPASLTISRQHPEDHEAAVTRPRTRGSTG